MPLEDKLSVSAGCVALLILEVAKQRECVDDVLFLGAVSRCEDFNNSRRCHLCIRLCFECINLNAGLVVLGFLQIGLTGNVQQFYFPNILKYDPDQLRQYLAGIGGAELIGTADGDTVQKHIDDIETEIDSLDERVLASDSADYRSRNIQHLTSSHFKLRKKTGLSILCQGDSETFGWDPNSTDATGTGLARRANVTYPERLGRYLSTCTGGQ